jgi:hypothetical protein
MFAGTNKVVLGTDALCEIVETYMNNRATEASDLVDVTECHIDEEEDEVTFWIERKKQEKTK